MLAFLISAGAGFIALSYEILWYRVFSFASFGRPAAFGLLLGMYLLGIALGAWQSRKVLGTPGDKHRLVTLGYFVSVASALSYFVVPCIARAATVDDGLMVFALGLVIVAAAMMGATLPLLCHYAVPPDDSAGQRLSYIYFANIVGSSLGSFVTGFILLDIVSLATTAHLLAGLGVVMGVSLSGWRSLGFAVVFLVGPFAYDRWPERLTYRQAFDTEKSHFVDVIETRSGVVTSSTEGIVYGGGVYDGRFNTSLAHDSNGVLRAFAAGALHDSPKRVLMIGLGSGSWAQVVAHHPSLEQLQVVEINRGYSELIARHAETKGLLTNPKVAIAVDDGRRWLQRHPHERFDMILMNTTFHWRAHMTNLLSREFMTLVKQRLLPGGLFYFNTTSSAAAEHTALSVFPHALRYFSFVAASERPVVLDNEKLLAMLRSYRIEGAAVVDDEAAARAHVYEAGISESEEVLRARVANAPIVTDDNMAVELRDPLVLFGIP